MEIGSIVECINDSFDYKIGGIDFPVKGKLYTIIGFIQKPKGMGIYIEEHSKLISVDYGDKTRIEMPPFLMTRFEERVPALEIKIEESIYNY